MAQRKVSYPTCAGHHGSFDIYGQAVQVVDIRICFLELGNGQCGSPSINLWLQ